MKSRHSPMSDRLQELFTERAGPCVSIYMPTGRRFPEKQQDQVRYRRLVDEAARALNHGMSPTDVDALMAPMQDLATSEPFWEHTLDGLAVLRAPDFFKVYKLQRAVPERAIVADSFHTKPLLRIAQSADRFHVLAVNRDHVRLFQGDRYALDEVHFDAGFPGTVQQAFGEPDFDPDEYKGTKDEIDQQTTRFFRIVSKAICDHYSKPAGIPMLLAALPQHQAMFRDVCHDQEMLDEGITTNPDALTPDDLRKRAWDIVEPRYLARLAGFVDDFHAGKVRELATDNLDDIAMAVLGGRVRVLLVEDDRLIPGRIDRSTGSITMGEMKDIHTDDLLDDLAEFTLRMAGDVVIVPTAKMPTKTGAAAIYRF